MRNYLPILHNEYMSKILIVEDDPLIVKIYSTRLKADGYEVLSAENGEEGLKIALAEKPDLVILDVMMPRMDGFGVLEKLRADYEMKDKPVLIYSNLMKEEDIERAKTLGVTEFLVKANYSPSQIVAKVQQYVGPPPNTPPAAV